MQKFHAAVITAPPAANKTQVSKTPEDQPQEPVRSNQLANGAVTLQRNVSIPLSFKVSAAIRGIKFQGSVGRNATTQVVGIGLNLRRADNLISVAILINAMMIGLAISVLAMVLHVRTASGVWDLVPLSLSLSPDFWFTGVAERAAWSAIRRSVQRLCHLYWGRIDRSGVRCSYRLALAVAAAFRGRILVIRDRTRSEMYVRPNSCPVQWVGPNSGVS